MVSSDSTDITSSSRKRSYPPPEPLPNKKTTGSNTASTCTTNVSTKTDPTSTIFASTSTDEMDISSRIVFYHYFLHWDF